MSFNPKGDGPWWVVCRDGVPAIMTRFNSIYLIIREDRDYNELYDNGRVSHIHETPVDVVSVLGPVHFPKPHSCSAVFDGPGMYVLRTEDELTMSLFGLEVFVSVNGKESIKITDGAKTAIRPAFHEFARKLKSWDEMKGEAK